MFGEKKHFKIFRFVKKNDLFIFIFQKKFWFFEFFWHFSLFGGFYGLFGFLGFFLRFSQFFCIFFFNLWDFLDISNLFGIFPNFFLGRQASTHTSLGFFACSKQTFLVLGSPRTNFVFTPNATCRIFLIYFTIYIKPLNLNLSKFGHPSFAFFFFNLIWNELNYF